MKIKDPKEENLIKATPLLTGEGALLERQQNKACLEAVAKTRQEVVICWNHFTLLDWNMVLGLRYVTSKPLGISSVESIQTIANILFRGHYTGFWANWNANIMRLYPYSEPLRHNIAWKNWVVKIEP